MHGMTRKRKQRRDIELERAYERGLLAARLDCRPFSGIGKLARFPDVELEHEAVMQYEQMLLAAVPNAYREIHACESPNGLEGAQRQLDGLIEEIEAVRGWLDSFVMSAEEYAAARPELRTSITPPAMSESARHFASVAEFVADQPARGLDRWPGDWDAGGADFGYAWTWQDPAAPWTVTRWRVSYIDELREVYALQLQVDRPVPFIPFESSEQQPLVVWLLASAFAVEGERTYFTNPEWTYLTELEARFMHQRNSLVLLAEALATPADDITP